MLLYGKPTPILTQDYSTGDDDDDDSSISLKKNQVN
jgi:hypothetical protein